MADLIKSKSTFAGLSGQTARRRGWDILWHGSRMAKTGRQLLLLYGCTILGPVRIDNNVMVGAGAVVTKDVPDGYIVAGVPAKIVKGCLP